MPAADLHALLGPRNAIENASTDPVTDAAIVGMLRCEGGTGSQRRALFEDCSLRALARAGAAFGIGVPMILAAYAAARDRDGAANPDLERVLDDGR